MKICSWFVLHMLTDDQKAKQMETGGDLIIRFSALTRIHPFCELSSQEMRPNFWHPEHGTEELKASTGKKDGVFIPAWRIWQFPETYLFRYGWKNDAHDSPHIEWDNSLRIKVEQENECKSIGGQRRLQRLESYAWKLEELLLEK